jgi:hypothetical protein
MSYPTPNRVVPVAATATHLMQSLKNIIDNSFDQYKSTYAMVPTFEFCRAIKSIASSLPDRNFQGLYYFYYRDGGLTFIEADIPTYKVLLENHLNNGMDLQEGHFEVSINAFEEMPPQRVLYRKEIGYKFAYTYVTKSCAVSAVFEQAKDDVHVPTSTDASEPKQYAVFTSIYVDKSHGLDQRIRIMDLSLGKKIPYHPVQRSSLMSELISLAQLAVDRSFSMYGPRCDNNTYSICEITEITEIGEGICNLLRPNELDDLISAMTASADKHFKTSAGSFKVNRSYDADCHVFTYKYVQSNIPINVITCNVDTINSLHYTMANSDVPEVIEEITKLIYKEVHYALFNAVNTNVDHHPLMTIIENCNPDHALDIVDATVLNPMMESVKSSINQAFKQWVFDIDCNVCDMYCAGKPVMQCKIMYSFSPVPLPETVLSEPESLIMSAYFTYLSLKEEGQEQRIKDIEAAQNHQKAIVDEFYESFMKDIESKFAMAVENNDFCLNNVLCNGVVLFKAAMNYSVDGENMYSLLTSTVTSNLMLAEASKRLNATRKADDAVQVVVTVTKMRINPSNDGFGIVVMFE